MMMMSSGFCCMHGVCFHDNDDDNDDGNDDDNADIRSRRQGVGTWGSPVAQLPRQHCHLHSFHHHPHHH